MGLRDFPGGPLVKTPIFHGRSSIPDWGTKIPHAIARPKKKKEGASDAKLV